MQNLTIDDIQIFVVTHNRKEYLKQAIDSILNQTINVKTITVLDNESTDGTETFVKSYNKEKVQYVQTTGFLGNYYKAKELISKKYCMLFHDDDILHPNYLKTALKLLNKYKNVSLLTTKYTNFYNNEVPQDFKKVNSGHYLFNNQYEFARYMYFVEHVSYAPAIYRSCDFLKIDIEYEKFSKYNDWPLMVKISDFGKTVFLSDNKMIYTRLHQYQDSWTTTNTFNVEQTINWVKYFHDILKNTDDKEFIEYLLAKEKKFLEERYKTVLDKKIKETISFDEFMDIAEKNGLSGVKNAEKRLLLSEKYKKFHKKIENLCIANSFLNKIFTISNNYLNKRKPDKKYWINYFKKYDEQKHINELADKLQGKKILLYGYGIIGQLILGKYDLSKLDIVAIADSKFSKMNADKVHNYKAIEPALMQSVQYDVILSALITNVPIFELANKLQIDKPIISLIVKP